MFSRYICINLSTFSSLNDNNYFAFSRTQLHKIYKFSSLDSFLQLIIFASVSLICHLGILITMKDSLIIFLKGVNQEEEEGAGRQGAGGRKEDGRSPFKVPKFLTRFSSTYFKKADVDSPQIKELQRRKREKKKFESLSKFLYFIFQSFI